jgi:outer membrane lipoprotein-sorting protein
LEAHYASLVSWRADFEQTTYIDMLDQKTVKEGQIAVKRPERIRVAYTPSPAKVYVSDGKKLWIYKEDEAEAWQFDKPKKIISEEALSFLKGLNNLSQVFTVVETPGEEKAPLTINNRTLHKITLLPKNPDSVLKLIVGVDEKTTMISEAVLYNTSGNITHYLFKNVELNPALEDTLFTLPAEPKRKIIKK